MGKKSLFWLCTSALLLAGCINDDDPSNVFNEQTANGNGNGNVSFVFTMNGASVDSKAPSVEDSEEYDKGTEAEYKLSSVKLYLYDSASGNLADQIDVALNPTPAKDGNFIKYSGQATVKKAGTYDVFAIANSDQPIDEPTEDAFLARISSGSGIINSVPKNGFMMTNRGADNLNTPIQPSTDGSKPTITIPLERVVAKVKLKTTKSSFTLKNPTTGDTCATISINNYKFVNLSRYFYNFRHVASFEDRDEMPSAPSYSLLRNFSNIEDVIGYLIDPYFFNKTVAGAPSFDNKINDETIYDQSFVEHTTDSNYTGALGQGGNDAYKIIYCYENAMFRPAQWTAYCTGIMFKGSMTPKVVYNENRTKADINGLGGIFYFNYQFYSSLKAVKAVGGANIPTELTELTDPTDLTPSDIEKLKNNYQIYYFKKSEGGFATYYNYWIKHFDNGDPNELGVMEYSIVRNNVYQVEITDVKALGPGTPDKEIKPIEDGVLLTVQCNIRPWIVRYQGAELE